MTAITGRWIVRKIFLLTLFGRTTLWFALIEVNNMASGREKDDNLIAFQ